MKTIVKDDQITKLGELIDKYELLKKDFIPTEKNLEDELYRARLQILERARARTSYTGDLVKDLCIIKFGNKFRENYAQLERLRDLLKKFTGEYVLVHDTGYNLLVNELDEKDRCYIPFRIAALGIIDENPLEAGYECDITGDRFYLKLRFKDGKYIREMAVKEHGKLDKWLNVIPTFRGRGESYTEKSEPLTLVDPLDVRKSADDYIRHLYTEGEWESHPKKPYWRIAPDKFSADKVTIGSDPVVEIVEKQEFPEKIHKTFALYIGTAEVMMKLGVDVKALNTIQSVYENLRTNRGKSLIF